jgi:hypothetical protein
MMPSARTHDAGPVLSFYRPTPERDTAFTAGAGIVEDVPQPEPRERALGGRQHPGNRHRITWTLLGHRRAEPAEHRVRNFAEVLRMGAARPGEVSGRPTLQWIPESRINENFRIPSARVNGRVDHRVFAGLRVAVGKNDGPVAPMPEVINAFETLAGISRLPPTGGECCGTTQQELGTRARAYFWR